MTVWAKPGGASCSVRPHSFPRPELRGAAGHRPPALTAGEGGTQQVQEARPVHRPSSPRHGVHALGCAVASKARDRPLLCP